MGRDDEFKFSPNVLSVEPLRIGNRRRKTQTSLQVAAQEVRTISSKRYYVVYKCASCGYETTTTNVCRDCKRNMYATGKEDNVKRRKRNLRKNNLKEALNWNFLQFQSDKLQNRDSPRWAFGLPEWIGKQRAKNIGR